MKKILQTCFLILLCLFGSNLTALSKVVQSPGAYSLHRLVGPSRGGETLSDTFLSTRADHRLLSGVEALVDRYLDSGAGEEIPSLQPAPVTVFAHQIDNEQEPYTPTSNPTSLESCVACAEHLTDESREVRSMCLDSSSPAPPESYRDPVTVLSNQTQIDEEPNRKSSESKNLDSCFLCLDSSSPAPVTVFLVHRIPETAGNLVVDLWDSEMYGLENFDNHQRMEIPPMAPHMLTGLMPREERGYKFRTPSISTPSILRLSLAHYPVIRDFQVSPGDSVMIMVNEKTASLIFTGPSAPKFRIQKELNEVVNAFTQSLDVGLYFNSEQDLQVFLDRPGNRAAWDSISTSFGRKTILKVAGQPELEYLQRLKVEQSVLEVQERLDLYKDKVPKFDLQAIYAGAIGSIYQIYLRKLSSAYAGAVKLGDPELTQRFRDFIQTRISSLPENLNDTLAKCSPVFREYLIARATLKASISDSEFFDTVFELYSQEVAERLAVQYLSDSRRKLPDFENQAGALDARLKSVEMKSVLAEMTGRLGQGAPLFSFDLPTLDGNRITPQDFEGKTLLIDFWITGCGACKSFHERIFDPLIEKYSKHPDLQIISVCADRKPDYWIQQGGTPDVSHEGFIPAYAERSNDSNPLLSHYNIHSYPQMMLVRPEGTLFRLSRVPATLAEAEALLREAMRPTEPIKPNSSPSKSQKL